MSKNFIKIFIFLLDFGRVETFKKKTLSLTYNKFQYDLHLNQLGQHSLLEQIFLELLKSLTLNTVTALFLLSKYLYTQEYLEINVEFIVKESADFIIKLIKLATLGYAV